MNALELKVPPVALALILAAGMWVASVYTPSLTLAIPWRTALSVALSAAGVAFALAGALAFRRANTTINPAKPEAASTVVTSGVYGVSRNPMYVGILLVLTGWAFFLHHALTFFFLPVFVAYMDRFQIAPEERALSALFGSEYATYKRSVRRWL
ncbi:MAG: isoprenylcysteine carboxylmethyltransferase family protein [Deltaproteobacteria bacterium]|nr:isoprenylcysteine carboxylmethyltransferase family protein [Deltaproteobacteria bacterium]